MVKIKGILETTVPGDCSRINDGGEQRHALSLKVACLWGADTVYGVHGFSTSQTHAFPNVFSLSPKGLDNTAVMKLPGNSSSWELFLYLTTGPFPASTPSTRRILFRCDPGTRTFTSHNAEGPDSHRVPHGVPPSAGPTN